METWAHCSHCSRWFYWPDPISLDATDRVCPVCCAAPDRFEQRRRIELPEIAFD